MGRDEIFKAIVLHINAKLKKENEKGKHFSAGMPFLFVDHMLFSKIAPHWPLKRGAVAKKSLAWNHFENKQDVIQGWLAFLVKCCGLFYLRSPKGFSEPSLCIERLASNLRFLPVFWDLVKPCYLSVSTQKNALSRPFFVEKILPHNGVVLLCLDGVFFRLRTGTNQELTAFEHFIDDLVKFNCSLVVYSSQSLLKKNPKSGVENYFVSFKMQKEPSLLSLQDALVPNPRMLSKQFLDSDKTASFDRLAYLLACGQKFIEDIEVEFERAS